MPNMFQNLLTLVGRIGLATLFIISGFGKLMAFHATTSYMASKGLPFVEVGAILTIIIEIGGGVLLFLGWQTRWTACVIALFVVAVTLTLHTFWLYEAAEMQNQMVHFLKNFALLGGLLYVIAFGAGGYSMDAYQKKYFTKHR